MEGSQTTAQATQRKGLKKLWAKIKASRKSQSGISQPATSSTTPTATAAPTESKPEPVPTPTQEAAPITSSPEPVKETEVAKDETLATKPTEMANSIEVDEADADEATELPTHYTSSGSGSDKAKFDRAQAVFAKYNMTLDAADWYAPSKSNVERIEKKPRMRVRHTCHECKATFGREKVCSLCKHQRCNDCVRYPPKRSGDKAVKAAKKTRTAVAATITDLTTTGACHECKTSFAIGDAECGTCNHKICERCLKETVIASPATAPPATQPVAIAA